MAKTDYSEQPVKQGTEEPEEDKKEETSKLTNELDGLSEEEKKKLLEQVDSEYKFAHTFIKPRWDDWGVRLKLLCNQKRDRDAIGEPMMFTIFQTVLANLYEDRMTAAFEANERGDRDQASNLTELAKYDYRLMKKEVIDYDWIWDTAFFGRGLVLMQEFSRDFMAPAPMVIDPLTFLRDPKAKSMHGDMMGRGAARFCGFESSINIEELEEMAPFLEEADLKPSEKLTEIQQNRQMRDQAQGTNKNTNGDLCGENADMPILTWFTKFKGKRVMVNTIRDNSIIVRFVEIKKTNKAQKIAPIPIVDRPLFPMSHDWDGLSIPDLIEDKQRAKAILLNMGLKTVKAGAMTRFLYDKNKITNRNDLNYGDQKHIGVNGNPNGVVVPAPSGNLGAEVQWILNVLEDSAQKATATPSTAQGYLGAQNRTATEVSKVSQGADVRNSLSARIFGWSEVVFWSMWYSLYKANFKDKIDEKVLRLSGALSDEWRPLGRSNIITNIDPDITIVSSSMAEAERMKKLQAMTNFLQTALASPNTNQLYTLRMFGRVNGLEQDDIDMIVPPTVDELIAEEENRNLEKNEAIAVDAQDDHVIHMEIHNKLSDDLPAKYAHIQAHKRALILKKQQPQLFSPVPSGAQPTSDATAASTTAPVGSDGGQSGGAPIAPAAPNQSIGGSGA